MNAKTTTNTLVTENYKVQINCGVALIPNSASRSAKSNVSILIPALSRRRIVIENINAQIKVFKIMSYPYRNQFIFAILNAEKA